MQTIAQDNPFAGTGTTHQAGSRPTYIAALLWGGLMLCDARLRAFLPRRERSQS